MHTALVLFVAFIACGESAVWFAPNAAHPNYTNKCYLAGPPPVVLSVGETKRVGDDCSVVECTEKFTVHGTGCGVRGVPPGCRKLRGDLSRPFPDCCPEVIC